MDEFGCFVRENSSNFDEDFILTVSILQEHPMSTRQDQDFQIQISTKFYPGSSLLCYNGIDTPADVVLVSSDSVFFYVHSNVLLKSSINSFDDLILAASVSSPSTLSSCHSTLIDSPPSDSVRLNSDAGFNAQLDDEIYLDAGWTKSDIESPVSPSEKTANGISDYTSTSNDNMRLFGLPEHSHLLNILLHLIYGLDCTDYSPTLDLLIPAVRCLIKYGYNPIDYLTTPLPTADKREASSNEPCLFNLFLSHAEERPLEVYAFAASYELDDLAVAASRHLLDLALYNLTDRQCTDIGPIYLKRLFFLHLGRVDALKVGSLL